MKNLVLFLVAVAFSGLVNAKVVTYKPVSKGKLTIKFVPKHTTREVSRIDTVYQDKGGKIKMVQKLKTVTDVPDISRSWWKDVLSKYQPDVVWDYVGAEDNSNGNESFIVFKKGNKAVILFDNKETTYAIYDAEIIYSYDYYYHHQKSLLAKNFPTPYCKNEKKYFTLLKNEFKSKDVVPLTRKNFESYFKKR